jgi:hypothetical protein
MSLFSDLLPINDSFVAICCSGNVITEPLLSNGRPELHYSGFQPSCHNTDTEETNVTKKGLKQNEEYLENNITNMPLSARTYIYVTEPSSPFLLFGFEIDICGPALLNRLVTL